MSWLPRFQRALRKPINRFSAMVVALALLVVFSRGNLPVPPLATAASTLSISGLTANATSVPLYGKLELTFNVNNTVATNLQFPYDPVGAPGLTPRTGVSVQALFLPPGQSNWSQAIVQPGFLYQDYQRQQINNQEWLYPNGQPDWKVRFAPKSEGTWQYQVQVQDASVCAAGVNPCSNWISTPIQSFDVGPAQVGNHGFVQASTTDPRYMDFSDGTPFVGLGDQTAFNKSDFTYDAANQLATDAANGIQLHRVWMDSSDIAGSTWGPWSWFGGPFYSSYLPDPGLWIGPTGSGYDYVYDLTQGVVSTTRTCIFNGWSTDQGPIAVKPNTTYVLKVTAQTANVLGPRNSADPNFGLTIKQGGWPNNCPDDLSSQPNLVPYLANSSPTWSNWTTEQGTLTTGSSQYFLNYLFMMLDNTTKGQAHIAQITLQEQLPDGSLGPNLLMKSQGNVHEDYNQLRSWDWDNVLDQAAQDGVYFKLVTLEKQDRVWDFINGDGTMSGSGGDNNFYSQDGQKVRQLQYYYYRYLAARWGYSTAIQSWEVANEEDPGNTQAYDQVNKLAGFMHQWDHNHMVSTSFSNGFDAPGLWNNASYPNPDYADIHAYTDTSPVPVDEHDAASLYINVDQYVRSKRVNKPVIRGETGIETAISQEDPQLANDIHGVWLHNLTWAQLDSGGMYDLEFYADNIIKNNLYFQYLPVRQFLESIPLANGHYQDAGAVASSTNVRVVGQKDLVNGRAHLWIQNKNHTWYNVVNNVAWGQLSGTVTIGGFTPNRSYPVVFWEFDNPGNLTKVQSTVTADGSGNLTLDLSTLPSTVTDTAVMIGDYSNAFDTQVSPVLK